MKTFPRSEYINTITESIFAQVMNMSDQACVDAIYLWAAENKVDEVMLCDEEKLRKVLHLGFVEYQRLYGD